MSALAYFLTWTTYGTWLRGDPRGSVVDENRHGFPFATHEPKLVGAEAERMNTDALVLSSEMRGVVGRAIEAACAHRGWRQHALNVRSNHVHAVITPNAPAEKAMSDLKAWATRALRDRGLVAPDCKVWTRHGSTRHLFDDGSLEKAIDSVVRHQDVNGER